MAEKFLVVDGSSLIHRAFFALPPLTNKNGVPTGAVYGLCNMLVKLMDEVKPKYMAVAFDKSRKSFRTEMFAEYKGQRKPTPPELKSQFPLSMKVLETLGIKTLELADYEADDIIGTFAVHAPEDIEVIIVTGDKDELQLVDRRTKVYFTKRGITDIQIYDEAEFAANYEGLAPKQIIELKGLMGDSSDNIPGVPGVGPKTALKLIKEYGDVATVVENIDKISSKSLRQKLLDNKDSALLSQRLATIYTDTPIDLAMETYELRELPPEAQELLLELDFRNMYDKFVGVLGSSTAEQGLFSDLEEEPAVQQVHLDSKQAKAFFQELAAKKAITYLVANVTGELPHLAISEADIYYEDSIYIVDNLSNCWQDFYAYLAAESLPKATIDSKEIAKACICQGYKLAGIVEDVALAAYLTDPGLNSYELGDLAKRFLPKEKQTACENLAELVKQLRERLAERELVQLYETVELPLALVLAQMECNGIKPDIELLDQLNEDMSFRISKLERVAAEQAGEKINLKSPKQLGVLLFETLGLPVLKKTKTGYSTDVSVLEQLEGKHPVISTILEYRKLTKLQSTYLEGLKPLVNKETGRIHTHFQQTVAVTGRLSSTDPNLQNIPTRTEEGRQIRNIFVPGEGYDYLMSCDYSQVELRILACIAQDKLLLDSFRHGQDVHASTAAEVMGLPLEEITKEQRTKAKAVNFGIVYGISDFGLAKQLDVTRAEAAGYIKSYFARYTGVKQYMEDIVARAREQGYVSTMMGRRRYLPDIRHSNFNLRSFAERTAINTPIQGSAADIMKVAMLKVAKALQEAGVKSRILLQVHDELVLEVTEAEKEQVAKLVAEAMESAVKLEIPLLAEVAFGKNWAEAK